MRYFLQASTPACAARPARRVRVPPASKAANTAPLCAWRDALCRKCGALALGPLAAGALLAALPLPAAAAAELPYSGGQGDLFEPARYVGRWYEVASEKRGFAGEGQADCHCTQVRNCLVRARWGAQPRPLPHRALRQSCCCTVGRASTWPGPTLSGDFSSPWRSTPSVCMVGPRAG